MAECHLPLRCGAASKQDAVVLRLLIVLLVVIVVVRGNVVVLNHLVGHGLVPHVL